MSEDWLPTETKQRQGNHKLILGGLVLSGIGLCIGFFLSQTQTIAHIERAPALGEHRFLFDSQALMPKQAVRSERAQRQQVAQHVIRHDVENRSKELKKTTSMPWPEQSLKQGQLIQAHPSLAPEPNKSSLAEQRELLLAKRKAEQKAEAERRLAEKRRLAEERRLVEEQIADERRRAEAERIRAETEKKAEMERLEAKRLEEQRIRAEKLRLAEEAKKRVAQQKAEAEKERREKAREKAQKKKDRSAQKALKKASTVTSSKARSTTWDQAHYSLQVKAFRSEKEASNFLDVLDQQWPKQPTRVLSGMSGKRPIYRVLLGAFKTRKEAKVIRREFMEQFGAKDKPFIKRLD